MAMLCTAYVTWGSVWPIHTFPLLRFTFSAVEWLCLPLKCQFLYFCSDLLTELARQGLFLKEHAVKLCVNPCTCLASSKCHLPCEDWFMGHMCTGCATCVQITCPSIELQLSHPCCHWWPVAICHGEEQPLSTVFSAVSMSLGNAGWCFWDDTTYSAKECGKDNIRLNGFSLLWFGSGTDWWCEPWLQFPPSAPPRMQKNWRWMLWHACSL